MLLLKSRACVSAIGKFNYFESYSHSIRQLSLFPWRKNNTVDVLSDSPINNANFENFYLPEPPNAPDVIESLIQYNHLGEATFHSLGLNSYWPPGWVQYFYETLHVSLDLPWWSVIAISAVCARALMMPLTLRLRKLNTIQQQLTPEYTRIEKKVKDSYLINDYITLIRSVDEFSKMRSNTNFQPYKMMVYTLLQFPIFLSVMMGLRQMSQLPVASLQTGGLFWFQDLTMADPYYILPISTMILFWLQIEVGADLAKNNFGSSPYRKWGVRVFPIIGALFTCNLPSALLLYWWCSSAVSLMVAGTMKLPVVKKVLRLTDPVVVTPTQTVASKVGFFTNWKRESESKRIYEMATKMESLNNEKWLKAATETIPKTFTYDPTKVKTEK